MKKIADSLMDKYPLSKTLRFELQPIGKTLDYIKENGILEHDFKRAKDYQAVKKIIDRYHKIMIDEALKETNLSDLESYYNLYCKQRKDDKDSKQFKKVQADLRKQIVRSLKSHPNFKKSLKKEMIIEILPQYAENEDERALIGRFKDFTTYFVGFHKNRENMYSDEEKSTAIAYRLVHQNLPKYIDNMRIFREILESELASDLQVMRLELKSKLRFHAIEEYFTLTGYNYVLTQKGIDDYNLILSGYSDEKGIKVQGFNEYINQYNQNHRDQKKLPKLKPLFKQILSDRESASFLSDQFNNDQEVLDAVELIMDRIEQEIIYNQEVVTPEKIFGNLEDYDLGHIYIKNDNSLSSISQELFSDWKVIRDIISEEYDKQLLKKNRKIQVKNEKYFDDKEKKLKAVSGYTISELNEMLREHGYVCLVEEYYQKKSFNIHEQIQKSSEKCRELLVSDYDRNLKKDENSITTIKTYLDSLKELQRMIKTVMLDTDISDGDPVFYAEINRIWESLSPINQIYNKICNYVTQKPYSTEKIKLNFDKGTLLHGWDRNQERADLGVLFEKEGLYYLGIINRNNTGVLTDVPIATTKNRYRKMNYKLLPGPNKMLPKVFLSEKGKETYHPSEELIKKYEAGTHVKGENFSKSDCHALIDFFKQSIAKNEDWRVFDFHFSDTETYEDISGFYREVEQQGYNITFDDIDSEYIDHLVETGQLYLFKIYNKDFSPYSSGTPNLHTLYWKALFSKENQERVVYKLDGRAEIFYRKRSIEDKDIISHPAGLPLLQKNAAEKTYSVFNYELIKDKRYTEDKFQFHVPITMNFGRIPTNNINSEVNLLLKTSDLSEVNVIGIDRGERNLLYAVVVNQYGKIVKQVPLNKITSKTQKGVPITKDYHDLLDDREKKRKKAREEWKAIGDIKDLKEGYLSQAVHIIIKLMIEYNAIVVLEDLNFGFKRGRQKVEKQIYQKFEKMLIDKLNYYVDKQADPNENGGLYHAYQLSNRLISFDKLDKQSGLLYYIPAWLTSKIDPTTGFANLFYVKYKSIEDTRMFLTRFEDIRYNQSENYFEFIFDYSNFDVAVGDSRTKWTVCSYGTRIKKTRKQIREYDAQTITITEEWIKLFEDYGIDYVNKNVKEQLLNIEHAAFYKRFIWTFSIMMQMRNSNQETGEDYVISPVKNSNGTFFKTGTSECVPADADANGAYHIARKGWWIIEQIQKMNNEELKKIPVMKNGEWLQYMQENPLTE